MRMVTQKRMKMLIPIIAVVHTRDDMNSPQWTVFLQGYTKERPNTVSYKTETRDQAVQMELDRQARVGPVIAALRESLAGYGVI